MHVRGNSACERDRACGDRGGQLAVDISKGYVAGIDGLYEFDCGKNSGWMYRVNGKFPNYMAGKCTLHDGDKVEWLYTCVRGDL